MPDNKDCPHARFLGDLFNTCKEGRGIADHAGSAAKGTGRGL